MKFVSLVVGILSLLFGFMMSLGTITILHRGTSENSIIVDVTILILLGFVPLVAGCWLCRRAWLRAKSLSGGRGLMGTYLLGAMMILIAFIALMSGQSMEAEGKLICKIITIAGAVIGPTLIGAAWKARHTLKPVEAESSTD